MKSYLANLRANWHWESLMFRRALRSAIVVLISILLYRTLSITQGYWVTLTAMLVVQTTVGATLRKSIQRFIGTLIGVTAASFLLLTIHSIYIIDMLVIFFMFFTYFFNPFNNLVNYGFKVVPLSMMVVFMMALVTPDKINVNIIYARFYDTLIGAGLGVAGSLFLFPNKVKKEFFNARIYICQLLADYLQAIIQRLLNNPHANAQLHAKKALLEQALLNLYQLQVEHPYEFNFSRSSHAAENTFLPLANQLAQRLFSLQLWIRYPLKPELLADNSAFLEKAGALLNDMLRYTHLDLTSIQILLQNWQIHLANRLKNADNNNIHWQEIAALANINLNMFEILPQAQRLSQLANLHTKSED